MYNNLLYHDICELHSFTPTQQRKYWAVAWPQCLLHSIWGGQNACCLSHLCWFLHTVAFVRSSALTAIGCWCFCVTGMGTNGTEAKVSWEEGLYTPQGSSSSLAFLIPAASACVLADDYVSTGGPWRLKRLDFGMRLHAVLFSVMLLSLCDVASYFQLSSPNRFSKNNTVLIQMKCQLVCDGACWTPRCRSSLQLYLCSLSRPTAPE